MALQMIYGRANSGKTQFILEKSEELFKKNKPFIIIVPEQFTHISEKRLIEKIGSIRSDTAEVLSFERIAGRIYDLYPGNKKIIGSVGKSLIMSKVISESELKYYKGCSDQIGFSNVCAGEISMLKKYNITPAELKAAADNSSDITFKHKFADIANIYEKYDNELKISFNDSDDLLNIFNHILESEKPYIDFTFIFDEFSSFNPQEISVIASIAQQAENVFMTLTRDGDEKSVNSVFEPTYKCSAKIKNECEKRGVICKKDITLPSSYYNSEDISYLEKNLYVYPLRKTDIICKNIRIYTSENPYSEVSQIAAQIAALVREKKIRYRDISVVCPDVESYSNIIRSTFSMYSIPCFIDEKTDVLNHSLINFVINIFDVYINGYRSETIVNFLKSGYLNIETESIYEADNFITATGASKNTWLSDEKWVRTVESYCKDNVELKKCLDSVRSNYILPLAVFHDKVKGKKDVKYICEQLYSYLTESEFDKITADYIEHFKSENNSYMVKQYVYIWKKLIEALDMIVYIFGDKRVNLKEYRKYLFTAFSEQKIGIIPTSVDEVIVGDVLRSKSGPTKYQFIIGAVDSSFPSPQKDNSIIDDKDKAFLSSAGIDYKPDSEESSYYDRFLIYNALTHPSDALIISYPMSDSAFSSERPSFVVTLIENMFSDLKTLGGISSKSDLYLGNINFALEFLADNVRKIKNGEEADDRWQDIYYYLKTNKKNEEIQFISDTISGKNKLTCLSEKLTDKLFDREFYSTVSRMQKYNACRYSYYLQYMLSLKAKEKFGFESVDIGSLAHEIIEKIFEDISKENTDLKDTDEIYFRQKVNTYIDSFIKNSVSENCELTTRDLASVERLRDSLVMSLNVIKRHIVRSKFIPMGYELVFDDNNIGCIELDLKNGKKLKLTGKIDRADSFKDDNGTYIRVIDYKTGNKKFDYTDVFYGLDIQILIYLDALVERDPLAKHAGALYFKIDNPSFESSPEKEITEEDIDKSFVMSGVVADAENVIKAYDPLSIILKGNGENNISFTAFKQLSEYLKNEVSKSAYAMSKGEIDINPYEISNLTPCNYCPYMSICGFNSDVNDRYRKLDKVNKMNVLDYIKRNTNGGENQ